MKNPLKALWVASAIWTFIGLLSGFAYRTFTKDRGFTGQTQLALTHTHALALGTLVGLVALALVTVRKPTGRPLPVFFWTWNAGLLISLFSMSAIGVNQVLTPRYTVSAALAGVSGLGHVLLTIAFIALLVAVRPDAEDASASPARS